MTINIPDNEQELIDQSRADVQEVLPESNPFLPNSFLDAMITANAGRIFDFYRNLEQLQVQIFIDTATGDQLDRIASWRKIFRNPATSSLGNVIFTGTNGTIIPLNTALQSSDSNPYTTTSDATISANEISITITRVGTLATATSSAPHNLGSGMSPVISGAVETEYNGTVLITVISETEFTYDVAGSPSTPATGVTKASFSSASAPIQSDGQGVSNNLDNGALLSLGSPIAGVNTNAIVDASGLSGGTDQENDTNFRARAIQKYQNPNTPFNSAGIISQAKLINGVTRVFVREITPNVGQVTIYFTRDNDVGGNIPSATEVNTVKDSILLIKPAHTNSNDVIVEAPVGVPVNFTLTGISPNTTTMQAAIRDNLSLLFLENTNVGVNLKANDYISAINRTVDTVTGNILEDFTINSPSGDITMATNELPILGNVSFV